MKHMTSDNIIDNNRLLLDNCLRNVRHLSLQGHLRNMRRRFRDRYILYLEEGGTYLEAFYDAVKGCIAYDIVITLERMPESERRILKPAFLPIYNYNLNY